jgi:phosphonate transport system permease protein
MQWGQGRYDQVVAIFIILFLTIVAIDRFSDSMRQRLTKGARHG